jgi:hypothetical protein
MSRAYSTVSQAGTLFDTETVIVEAIPSRMESILVSRQNLDQRQDGSVLKIERYTRSKKPLGRDAIPAADLTSRFLFSSEYASKKTASVT